MSGVAKKLNNNIYWSPKQMLTYDRLINMVIGGRGIGKTYGIKKEILIERFIKHGEEFIYVRRYKTHLKPAQLVKFFEKVAKEFPKHEFVVKGNNFYIDGKIAGYAIPLSAWQNFKSTEYPNVYTIFYDEFLKEKDSSHYLDNEPQALLNLIETIFREKIILGTERVRVIMASNSTTTANPYFVYFKLFVDINKRFNTFKHNKEIVVEIPNQEEFTELKRNGRFGELIKGTAYADLSIDNKFIGDSEEFIAKRTKESKLLFNIKFRNQIVGIWVDYDRLLMFCTFKTDNNMKTYALTKDDYTERNILVSNYRDKYELLRLSTAFKNGQVRFDSQIVRSFMYDCFTMMNIK